MDIYAIIGAGGFGREVMPLAAKLLADRCSTGSAKLVFATDHPDCVEVNGYEVWHIDDLIAHTSARKYFNIAIGDSRVRMTLATRLQSLEPFTITAPSHIELDANNIGEGAILCDNTMVTSNAVIGKHFHANIYSYIAHDCVIGDYVTFGPGVKCNGRVVIEDHAYIGAGSMIREGSQTSPIVIGRGAFVGMGSVVTKSVEAGTMVFGSPARFVKRL